MTRTEEIVCSCGLEMEEVEGATGENSAFVCNNCDGLQRRELMGFDRQMTKADIRFEMAWLRRMEEYENNTKSDEQTGSNDPDEELSS